MSFKRTKVVMLPTNEKAGLKLGQNGLLVNNTLGYDSHFTNQHLYFLCDDEIKEGDWWVDLLEKRIFKVTEEDVIVTKADGLPHNEFKKIIATTNTSLLIGGPKSKNWVYLPFPQPFEGFIQKFIESYDDGNPITEVDVEYDSNLDQIGSEDDEYFEKLKVNPKDNTITIKKVKDIWSREEVVNLLQQFNNDKPGEFDCSKWIEENI